jgi:ureidoacrylate peracid hydrolase
MTAQGIKSIIRIEAVPESIEIDLRKTAVIVVDMQNAFISKGGYFDLIGTDISSNRKIIGACKNVINEARLKGATILYLRMALSQDLSDVGSQDSPSYRKSRILPLINKSPELKEKIYLDGSWGAEIIDDLKPDPADIVIKKQRYDGFIGTNLDIILRTRQIKYLLFVGVATNVCVESTLRHAFFLDYFPILLSDAVSQKGSDPIQEASIYNTQSLFGWVSTSENILESIRSAPAQ